MQIVTLRYSPTLGGFDDRELQSVLAGREVHHLETHFFLVNQVPHVSFVASFQSAPLSPRERAAVTQVESPPHSKKSRGAKDKHLEGLDETGRAREPDRSGTVCSGTECSHRLFSV